MTDYFIFMTTGVLARDVCAYFEKFNCSKTYVHTLDVIDELKYIEKTCGVVESGCYEACLCHDLGRVVRLEDVFEFCYENNIPFTEEEKRMPSILHPKISAVIAERVFSITDEKILNAIMYHTTSRINPSMIEIEVLLADKMSWRDTGWAEFACAIKNSLTISKQYALFYYLRELYNSRDSMVLYHTDTREAYYYFRDNIFDKETDEFL